MRNIYLATVAVLTAIFFQSGNTTDLAYDVRKSVSSRSSEDGGLLEVGVGAVYADIPILGLLDDEFDNIRPTVFINGRYQKNNFFVEAFSDSYSGINLGYNAINNEHWSIDLVGSQQNAEISAEVDEAISGLDDRDADFSLGLRATGYFDKYLLQLELLRDVSSSHEGVLANATLGKNWQVRNWNFFAIFGARYYSDKALNYYFGIDAAEANRTRFAQYSAGSGVFYTGEIGFMYPLNEKWVMQWDAFYGELPDSVVNSPLTRDNDINVTSLSFRYVF